MPIQPKQQPPYYQSEPGPGTYTTLLTQTGTTAPTQQILTNTTGLTITLTYETIGKYKSTQTFNITKTAIIPGQSFSNYEGGFLTAWIDPADNKLYLQTWDTVTGNLVNDVLENTTLQLIIYP